MAKKSNTRAGYERTIFVTGGLGFIGSNYLNMSVPLFTQYRFVNIDCITYAAKKENIIVARASNYSFEKVDIKNLPALEKLFKKYKPTHIINFAAETHVDMSIQTPAIFFETNVLGTHNLLWLSKKYGLTRFYQISTDEVYGSLETMKGTFTEESLLEPNSPYSASKTAADVLVRAYHKTYGLPMVISRCSNNYGPRQDKTKFIPRAILSVLDGKKIPVFGKGKNVRDWIFVEDHVDAINKIFHRGRTGEIYNVGGECEMRNIDVAKKITRACGKDATWIEYVTDRPGHDFRYSINCSKIKKELGWSPKMSFESGLRKTLDYYRI